MVQPAGFGEPPHRRPATEPGGFAAAVGGLQLAQQLAVDLVARPQQDLDPAGDRDHRQQAQVLPGPGTQPASEPGQLLVERGVRRSARRGAARSATRSAARGAIPGIEHTFDSSERVRQISRPARVPGRAHAEHQSQRSGQGRPARDQHPGNGGGEQQAVEPVHHPAMAGKQVAHVLDVQVALDHRLAEVAERRRGGHR